MGVLTGTKQGWMYKTPFFMEIWKKMYTCNNHPGMKINPILITFANLTKHFMG
jgi:hypothetical protein